MRVVLIDHEDSFVYNLAQALSTLDADVRVVRYTVPYATAQRFDPDAVVLSPGPGHPTDARLTGLARRYLATNGPGLPILGVCLGHQLIGEYFGGRVVRAGAPVHGEVAAVMHDGRGLFRRVPSPFRAARYHSLVIEPRSCPPDLEVVARTPEGVVMSVRHTQLPIFGVQFHPESYMTPEGPHILANFLREARS